MDFAHVGAVTAISERFLVALLEALLDLFPFVVVGFLADNASRLGRAGSEHVNHTVAALINNLRVRDCTKSRPRRSTDNALVEGKNANLVRRFLGRGRQRRPRRAVPQHRRGLARRRLMERLRLARRRVLHRPTTAASLNEGIATVDSRWKTLLGEIDHCALQPPTLADCSVPKANHPRRRRSKGSSSYCNMLSSNCPTPSGGETGVRRIIR